MKSKRYQSGGYAESEQSLPKTLKMSEQDIEESKEKFVGRPSKKFTEEDIYKFKDTLVEKPGQTKNVVGKKAFKNGGYVRSADGCAKRGKTRGRIV